MAAMADDLADATASAIGGIITATVVYPVEIVKNRMVSEGSSSPSSSSGRRSTAEVVREILVADDLRGLYEGVTLSAWSNAVEKFLYFYSYSALRRFLQALQGHSSALTDLLAGCLAEIAHLPITVPLDTMLIKVVNNPGRGAFSLFGDVLRSEGLLSLYAGCAASVVLSVKPGIQFMAFEALKLRLLRKSASQASTLSVGQVFLLGALARALATVVVFPLIRAKCMLKNIKGDVSSDTTPQRSAVMELLLGLHRTMAMIVRDSGIAGLYRGMPQELVRATMSAALLMAIRERLTVVVRRALPR